MLLNTADRGRGEGVTVDTKCVHSRERQNVRSCAGRRVALHVHVRAVSLALACVLACLIACLNT
eukprot:5304817-Alexandrium_andersonii.AAC.1